ncbi:DUF2254 family protein [Methanochimaera problematica]
MTCSLKYAVLFVFVGALVFLIFGVTGFSQTNIDNARYMLSALVQGQAAIISIVITLTLVAVQLSAGSYSPRVIDIMKKNPDMWILLFIYAVLICYGLFILKSLEISFYEISVGTGVFSYGTVNSSPAFLGLSFEELVYFAYVSGVFSVFALIPYMLSTISLLKPETIIEKLADEINESNILNENKSPFQPVFDIIHSAIAKYDITTTRAGLNAVEKRVEAIMNQAGENRSNEISKIFCSYLERCAVAAINNDDEEIVGFLAHTAGNFGVFAAERGFEDAISNLSDVLQNIGVKSADKGLKDATLKVITTIRIVGLESAKKEFKNSTAELLLALENISESTYLCLAEVTNRIILSIGKIGMLSIAKTLTLAASEVVFALENIAIKSIENENEDATSNAIYILKIIGEISAKEGLEDETSDVINALRNIGESSGKMGFELGTTNAVLSILEIYEKTTNEKDLSKVPTLVSNAFAYIHEMTTGLKLEKTELIVKYVIANVSHKTAQKELEYTTSKAVNALLKISITSRKISENIYNYYIFAEFLAKMRASTGEIVQDAIDKYESEISENEKKSFSLFILIYENEYEMLTKYNL